jgi:hypothetical protein
MTAEFLPQRRNAKLHDQYLPRYMRANSSYVDRGRELAEEVGAPA